MTIFPSMGGGNAMGMRALLGRRGGGSNLVLLPQFDTTDAGTTFTDRSPSEHSITAVGNAQGDSALVLDSDQSLLLDGSGDYAEVAASADFDLGTADFTIEGFNSFAAAPGTSRGFIGVWAPSPISLQQWEFGYLSGQLRFRWKTVASGTVALSTTGLPAATTNELKHWAVVREALTLRIFFEGAILGSTTLSNVEGPGGSGVFLDGTGQPLRLGYTFAYLNGSMSNVRITKEALYTEAFTPPATDFTA